MIFSVFLSFDFNLSIYNMISSFVVKIFVFKLILDLFAK